jgi:hypothetical protein
MKVESYLRSALILVLLLVSASAIFAQNPTGSLHGQVSDPSGAAIAGASVIITPATGSPIVVQSNGQGMYEFKNLAAGQYTLTVSASGFTLYENDKVAIGDQPLRLNVSMTIEVETQKVQVSENAPTVDVNPNNNAGAITISGKELEALPDDPDELLSDIQALAGPSAGPNGGQMYIDGFTAGQLPPKASIREIRINQNPFSSEYDKLGYGRVEIFTRPGTDKFHGQFFVLGNASAFNTGSPFAGIEPGYDSTQYSANLGGPLGKQASFFVNAERRNINDLASIDTLTPDPGCGITGASYLQTYSCLTSVPNPRHRTNISPRLDYAINKNNTLTARYQFFRDTEDSNGIGQFTLPTQGYDETSDEHTFQIGDTQVYGAKVINETRFQYLRERDSQNALSTAPTINVRGAFQAGGNNQGTIIDHQDHYEVQNYTSVIHGNHTIKFGTRLRAVRDANYSTSSFNGTFTFSSIGQYQLVQCSLPNPPAACPAVVAGTPAPTPNQLSITTGNPDFSLNTYDAGLYVQDDWRVRPNITLSYGLRFETQNYIHDRGDWAPRFGFAWGVGGRSAPPKVVIRGGLGMFYDRFQSDQILEAERVNGVVQSQFVIPSPTCFPVATDCLSSAAELTPHTVYQISPRLHAPYTLQAALSVERQLTKSATLSVTYLNSRGFDQLATINANAPFPGTDIRPNPNAGNIYEYVSEANFNENQLIVNSNVRVGSKVQLFGYYTLNHANSDASGVSTFVSNSYDIRQDYGRASFDIRHRLFFGGSIALPYLFRLSPFLVASSGSPFNITVPDDLNNDSIFNDRPGFVSSVTCPVVTQPSSTSPICTPLGTFDAAGPSAVHPLLPINYGTGPSSFTLNMRLTKTFGLGKKLTEGSNTQGMGPGGPGGGGHRGGGGPRGPLFGGGSGMSGPSTDRRYNLTFGVNARNVFNRVNAANPSGVLPPFGESGASFFGIPNALQRGPFSTGSAVRRIDLQATFSF